MAVDFPGEKPRTCLELIVFLSRVANQDSGKSPSAIFCSCPVLQGIHWYPKGLQQANQSCNAGTKAKIQEMRSPKRLDDVSCGLIDDVPHGKASNQVERPPSTDKILKLFHNKFAEYRSDIVQFFSLLEPFIWTHLLHLHVQGSGSPRGVAPNFFGFVENSRGNHAKTSNCWSNFSGMWWDRPISKKFDKVPNYIPTAVVLKEFLQQMDLSLWEVGITSCYLQMFEKRRPHPSSLAQLPQETDHQISRMHMMHISSSNPW